MSLMFFLAGLLAAPSLQRKGAALYMWDRVRRIGVPFLLAVAFLSPLAYYASFRATAPDPSLAAFWTQWLALPFWPSGPPWFLWQLFVLSALGALLFACAPRAVAWLAHLASRLQQRPVRFFNVLVAVSAIAYAPLALVHSPFTWDQIGPFSLQLSRPLHYVVYFFAGFAIGAAGFDRGLLRYDGLLARHWLAWLVTALISFGLWGGSTSLTMPDWHGSPLMLRIAASVTFALACAACGIALLAICLRFARERHATLDSLSGNAYSIYLIHYVFVLWMQYALLRVQLPAIAKATIVCAVALAASWAISVAFSRLSSMSALPALARSDRRVAADQQR
jgi:peptidoglycan/LPS O-acetylase OafA/YrhL